VCEDGIWKGEGGAGKTGGAMRSLGATGAVVFRLRRCRGFTNVVPVDQTFSGFALPLGQALKWPEVMSRSVRPARTRGESNVLGRGNG